MFGTGHSCFFLGWVQSAEGREGTAAQIVEGLSEDTGIGREAALSGLLSQHRTWAPTDVEKLVDGLVVCLRYESLGTNAAAALARLAGEYPSQVRRAVPAVLDYLPQGQTDQISRGDTCQLIIMLGLLRENARQAGPRLRDIASRATSSPYVAAWAAGAVARIEPNDSRAVDSLRRRLAGDHASVAAMALGFAGDAAKAAIPDLRGLLKDSSGPVRVSAAGAIWQITRHCDSATLRVLISAIEEKPEALAPLAPDSVGRLTDDHLGLAAMTLAKIGPAARDATPALRRGAAAGDPLMRCLSLQALASIEADRSPRSAPPVRKK